jgi:hypothetical protein
MTISTGNQQAYEYLTREHPYTIATIPADWGILSANSPLLGKLGHHACIKLPGQRICEWTPTPTAWSQAESGVEVRTATGATIEKMWQSHLEMAPRYHQLGLFTPEGYSKYRPFTNDCFNYVDRILTDNNQPTTKLSRTSADKHLSNSSAVSTTNTVVSTAGSEVESLLWISIPLKPF